MKDENPYSAPEAENDLLSEETAAPLDELAEDEEKYLEDPIPYKYGGFLIRATAKVADLLLFSFLFILVGTVLVVIQELATPPSPLTADAYLEYRDSEEAELLENSTNESGESGLANLIMTLCLLLCGAICEFWTSATPGKFLLGLRVVRDDLVAPPSIGSAIGRNIAVIFDGMFMGIPALFVMRNNPYKQRMGDVGAHTLVVRKSSIPESLGVTGKDYFHCFLMLMANILICAFIMLVV